jgi:4,5-DOPA dioxygenase extradiol
MPRLPVVFISHGSPTHALEGGAASEAWVRLAHELPRPKSILIASAHWETELPSFTGASKPETIHDFGGFPEALYRIHYNAPGSPELAEKARALLKNEGQCAAVDGTRGLDHGAWTPLLHMYPEADIPVVQVAVQPALGAAHHLAVGRALAPLVDEDVLIIGSGHMTHNLREAFSVLRGGAVPGDAPPPAPYAAEFSEWVRGRIEEHDLDALAEYRQQAPQAARAHPSEEHFLPLFVALGAAGDYRNPQRFYSGIELGSLSMDAWTLQ